MNNKLKKEFQTKLFNDALAKAVSQNNAAYALFIVQQAEEMDVRVPKANETLARMLNEMIADPVKNSAKGIDLLLHHGVKPDNVSLKIRTWISHHNGDEWDNKSEVMAAAQVLRSHGYDIDDSRLLDGEFVTIKLSEAKRGTHLHTQK